ncbi:MAG: hypothetical protein PHV93_00935 [Candidatus Pacebacteria bacterium]|nr:hypothetical protein [Candidatus Paceibacterota bacterium]
MKNLQKGFVVPLLIAFIALLAIGGGIYLYSKNTKNTNSLTVNTAPENSPSGVSSNTTPSSLVSGNAISDYIFSNTKPQNLVEVRLSHHSIDIESPWGLEKSYRGSRDSLGQYTFVNGIKMTVTLNKLSPQDELKQSDFSPTELAQFNSLFQFIGSKIEPNFSSYEFQKFLHGTNQQVIDEATTQEDKTGYSKVLVLKNITAFFGSSTPVYQFANKNGKGFVYVKSDTTVPSGVDFWGPNGWRYTFMLPAKQNISKGDVDALIQSIKSL